ncbi:FAD/NAD(P)-binding protein [Streptomyces sp. NPDC047046]|uniref:FAD/NAD(P)-binding protein n=1 Tax=Streptomyces sp. NPDC047046 TaxID=3155378 RepID=UPI00340C8F74
MTDLHEAAVDFGAYVRRHAARGRLVVQPRMGMSDPARMAGGLRAVASLPVATVATMTLDSYTRVGDHEGARHALATGTPLNGFPLVAHGAEVTASVAGAAAPAPVQVRHGSARPLDIFDVMTRAGLTASEGGPVSYCLPYGRTPLAESVAAWRDATALLAERGHALGVRPHLETFGGCLLGQLCPPSLLIAMSVLEALFFAQHGVDSVSLSYAQQTHPGQDAEALLALRQLAQETLPAHVDRHVVLYTYMGVYPRSEQGARSLLDSSAHLAVRGGAERLIVKTVAEAHRIPSVRENTEALRAASRQAALAREEAAGPRDGAPHAPQDPSALVAEARALMEPVLAHGDVGAGLVAAFRAGTLDIPYCLHEDNRGETQGAVARDGRLVWARAGRMPLPSVHRKAAPLRAKELLHMLNRTADLHDRAALTTTRRIAVVGTGPRGLAVLERLVARLAAEPDGGPVEVCAIDACEPGQGRIWRTDQPRCLLMNTPAGEVTMFSGPSDSGPARPGAGPSLAEWWEREEPGVGGPLAYAPRGVYGRYLAFVLDRVEQAAPGRVRLRRVRDRVDAMRRPHSGQGWELTMADGSTLGADRVVLTTGHPSTALSPAQADLARFADGHPSATYIRGDSAADMPLDSLPAGATVGVLGLGLAFYDVMALLTEGRGGRFEPDGDGLRYLPSGREPRLVAGSRSGVPLPARGRNQKTWSHSYAPRLFTRERVEKLRADGPLVFDSMVRPWIEAEVTLVHHETALRRSGGEEAARTFVAEAVQAALTSAHRPAEAVAAVAGRHGVPDAVPLDLHALARPFAARAFPDRAAYRHAVTEEIHRDLAHAALGNAEGSLKAALDTLRDVRSVIRVAVDLGGLTARSYAEEFLGAFAPLAAHLAAGPPATRLRQVLALMDAGILDLAGPQVRFATDGPSGRFTVSSPQVAGAAQPLDALIDARIPTPDVRRDSSPLIAGLLADGVISSFVVPGTGPAEAPLDTGGLAVTGAPFHVVDARGEVLRDLHSLGIPTEHTRWFTQVGSGRPGKWGEFTADADAIAAAVLTETAAPPARTGAQAPPAGTGTQAPPARQAAHT